MHHNGFVSEWLLVSQIVGYAVSTVVVLLLAYLVRRASRFDDARAYAPLVGSVLLWNAGNLVAATAVVLGGTVDGALAHGAMMLAYTGGAMSPAGALIMWHQMGPPPARAIWLVGAALAVGATLTLLTWSHALLGWPLASDDRLWTTLAYHVSLFFALGAWVFYRGSGTAVAPRLGIAMAGIGALGVGISVFLEKGGVPFSAEGVKLHSTLAGFEIARQVATHAMTLGALFFFARFRFADVFIRQTLRMIAAACLGVVVASLARPFAALAEPFGGPHASAVLVAAAALAIAALVLGFTFVDPLIVRFVDRWLFEQPDYDVALATLRESLARERERPVLYADTARLVSDTLALQEAHIADGASGRTGVIVPVRAGDDTIAHLVATPRWDHPTLLHGEVEFLRAAAGVLGHRLDAVRREQDEIDRRTREAELRRQVSEATLKALQAQVNPHFLFNTLNTIADLIQEDPPGAEAMTLRLAEVFSHVLASGHRPFSSVQEEMAFLRTYLTIEEARFGDRLRVSFVVDPDAAHAVIPSLILQPAVENALKHGLSQKIGPGQLTISALVEAGELRLAVEDNGVGPSTTLRTSPSTTLRASPSTALRTGPSTEFGTRTPLGRGVGLRNIAERLDTLYADRASVRFEAAPRGGSLLTVRLPLHVHDQEPVG